MKSRHGIIVSLLMLLGPAVSWSGALVPSDQLTAQSAEKYALFPMKSGYAEKDESRGVVYMTAEEREAHRAVVVGGLIYDNKGDVLLDAKLGNGTLQYVMDRFGNIYVFDDVPTTRHSSVFGGAPVAAAGDIQVKNGFITYIDTNSGHYFVFTSVWRDALDQVLKELASRGVDANAIGGSR